MQYQLGNPDIVVVEDNEDEALLTTMALAKILPRPTVLVIPDGEQALIRLQGEAGLRPQLLLLDLKLPKVHGLDVLAALKADPTTSDIAVVILTSSDHPSDIERAQALGCNEYLCKPIDWQKYVELVCNATVQYLAGSTCSLTS